MIGHNCASQLRHLQQRSSSCFKKCPLELASSERTTGYRRLICHKPHNKVTLRWSLQRNRSRDGTLHIYCSNSISPTCTVAYISGSSREATHNFSHPTRNKRCNFVRCLRLRLLLTRQKALPTIHIQSTPPLHYNID